VFDEPIIEEKVLRSWPVAKAGIYAPDVDSLNSSVGAGKADLLHLGIEIRLLNDNKGSPVAGSS
jgi:hypothetical protein